VPHPLDPFLERRDLLAEPVFLAVPADSLAARAPSVELVSVATQPFLAPSAGTAGAEMVKRACALAGFVPRVVARATDFQVLLNFVAAGAGVMLIPELAADHVSPEVRLVRPKRSITRQVFTVSRRGGDRKPAVRVVLDALEAGAESLSTAVA
jgi:DNA-binding transcriptional LysR family regulator